jgi:hypothetical protein
VAGSEYDMEYDSEYEGGLKSEYGIRPIWGSKVNTGIRVHKLGVQLLEVEPTPRGYAQAA